MPSVGLLPGGCVVVIHIGICLLSVDDPLVIGTAYKNLLSFKK